MGDHLRVMLTVAPIRCEHGGEKGFDYGKWERIDNVLDGVSLGFSCLFMLELLANVFAFGSR